MRIRAFTLLAAIATIGAVSCDSSRNTAPPVGLTEPQHISALNLGASQPLVCPSQDSSATSATIGPLGGVLSAGGVTVSIPVGALLDTVTLALTVPASNNVEIDVSRVGADSFVFEQPIVVTVSYARCNAFYLDPIVAWHFDPVTRVLLEPMPSVDNKLLKTVTFTTGHLSGYILAN